MTEAEKKKKKQEEVIRSKVVSGMKKAKVLPGSASTTLFDSVTKKIKKATQ